MPYSGNGLLGGCISEIKTLNERDHVWDGRGFPCVDVSSFGGVAKEGSVPERRGGPLMPLPWVPGEILDEAGFEDPKDWGLLA
jgi:hypothetical protein